MVEEKLKEVLEKHKKWLNDEEDGERANLRGSDLRYSNLRDSDLRYSKLRDSNLRGSDLRYSKLRDSDLRGSDLRGSDLRDSDLRYNDLRDADLRDADLRNADLRNADLSNCKGLLSPIEYLAKNFEKTKNGYICYKTFGSNYTIPDYWKIKKGSIITEVVNPCRTIDCACGVNAGTLEWVKENNSAGAKIWKCLIKWEWLPGVVVPYNTSGKIRCEKIKLLEVYKEERESEYRNGKSGKKL